MNLDIPALLDFIEHSLPLNDFGFIENVKTDSMVIYNSKWCRVKFFINVDRYNKYLEVYYGRLHASDSEWIMKWNGNDCYCWHDGNSDLKKILQFLDGLSPEDAYKARWERLQILQDFDNSELAKSLSSKPEEKTIHQTSRIWQHFGIRLFEVFDIHRPDIWEAYIAFLMKYYKIQDEELDAGFRQKGLKRNPVSLPGYKRC